MKTILVDFDGVIAQYKNWKGVNVIGEPIPGAKEFLTELRKKGHVQIFSTRTNSIHKEPKTELVARIKKYMNKYSLPFDSIYSGDKPLAIAIIDDRAINVNPQKNGKKDYQKALGRLNE